MFSRISRSRVSRIRASSGGALHTPGLEAFCHGGDTLAQFTGHDDVVVHNGHHLVEHLGGGVQCRGGDKWLARPAASSSVLIFTFFKTSDHILHYAGNAVAEATHTLEDDLNLGGVFPLQVGIVKVWNRPVTLS